jgi:hypothetical protein
VECIYEHGNERIVVFQYPVARHLLSSTETDSLQCGLDYKMFTRKGCHYVFRLHWPSSGVLNVNKIAVPLL